MQNDWAGRFECCFREHLVGGASVSVWQHGRELCTLTAGENWSHRSLVPVFSATKPASAVCLLQALYECNQTPELLVRDIWPAFPARHCTIGQLLSHQCGLAALRTPACLEDTDSCRHAIESTTPAWLPPEHGYHPQTFGPMLEILMLELTGMRVGEFWEQRIRQPLQLDFYIGLPESEFHRVVPLEAPRLVSGRMPREGFYAQYFDSESAVFRAFHSIIGYDSARAMSTPGAWQCASPAKGGVASARGLAQFYQALLGDFFPAEVREWISTPQCCGWDHTLQQPTAFTCGAMSEPAELFPGEGFGHAGAGGSHAFCSPSTGISFAYVMNRMELGLLPGNRVRALLELL